MCPTSEKQPVLVITGPTASGKTSAAIQLAEKLDGEIISADSMQVYRGMDIGTAKATRDEQARVPHHLLDIRSPGESFSVAEYQSLATDTIKAIQARGKSVIISGGTGQYLSAMMEGLVYSPASVNLDLREQLNHEVEAEGLEKLWRQLTLIDPEAAARLAPTDQKRIIRALEVYRQTGETISAHQARSHQAGPAFTYIGFCLNHERSLLYERINRRVDTMIDTGLLDEVKWLVGLGLPAGSTCLQAIGYKELIRHLDGQLSLPDAIPLIQQSSRRYAKRQLTWFRKMANMMWLENKETDDVVQTMAAVWQDFFENV